MKHIYLLLLVAFPSIILTFNSGSYHLARAEEAEVEDDFEVEGEVEDTAVSDDGGDEEDLIQTGSSPDADTTILFTSPAVVTGNNELPAGHIVDFLVGFHNKGKQDFILETLEASFRYPMDFSYYIQNFSTIAYNKVVKPTHEATLGYSFMVPETFAGRPFGLNIHISYRDFEGNLFGESVFNETVNIVELEEGLDGETFFLYVFLAACIVLLLVVGQQFLVSVGKKRVGKKPVVETGTTNPDDVDYDWLPKQMLNTLNKTSPKSSPRANKNQSPQNANKRATVKQNQQQQQQQKQQQKQQQSPKQQQPKQQQSPKQQQPKQQQSPKQQQAKQQQQQQSPKQQQPKQQSPKQQQTPKQQPPKQQQQSSKQQQQPKPQSPRQKKVKKAD